jgi:TetR/AcrR family transcriptional regulator
MVTKKIPVHQEEAVRERLLHSAIDIFTERGYAAATVREIVETAGVTKPVLYYYFGSKEGIYLEIMKEALEVFRACLSESEPDGASARESLRTLCGKAYDLVLENLKVVRLIHWVFYGPRQGSPLGSVPPEAFHDLFEEAVRRLVERGIREEEFARHPEEAMVYAILGSFSLAIELEMAAPERSIGRNGLYRLLDVIFEGTAKTRRGGQEKRKA